MADLDALEVTNQNMLDAEKHHDVSFYKQLLSEDFKFRRANGKFADKKGYLEGLTSTAYSRLESSGLQSFLLTKDTAFVQCSVTAEGRRPDGASFQGIFNNVRFFRRTHAAWQLYAWHNTPADEKTKTERNFTGHVIVQTLSEDPANHVYQVYFHPSARTHWHIHTGIQDLFVVSGSAIVVQRTMDGDKRTTVRNGESIRIPPGILHCHGATPETFMIHITNNLQNKLAFTYWFDAVPDEHYLRI